MYGDQSGDHLNGNFENFCTHIPELAPQERNPTENLNPSQ